MKLEHIRIRDFRSIERMELSFKDDLGLVRDCLPIVGPNTSGKTTILDAIALSLMPATELYRLRTVFDLPHPHWSGLAQSGPTLYVLSGLVTTRSRPRRR